MLSKFFGYLDLVANGALPFSSVENDTFKQHVKCESITRNTLAKYMNELAVRVEKKIHDMLPERFIVIFNRRTTSDTHYVACFASFTTESMNEYFTVLLGFSTLEVETNQSAQNYSDLSISC